MKIRVFMVVVLLFISYCVFSIMLLLYIVIFVIGGIIVGMVVNNI